MAQAARPPDPYNHWKADRVDGSTYRVSGARQITDDKGKKINGLFAPDALRFQCILEDIAVDFAQGVFKKEGIILEIHEVPAT